MEFVILFEKFLAWFLFFIYDFLDTIGAVFNILTGTQGVDDRGTTLLEVFISSAVSTKVMIGLAIIAVVIAGACVGVRVVKNIIQLKAGGEPASHGVALKQGVIAIISSIACILLVFLFVSFASMLLNMVNDVITPVEGNTLSQNMFNLSVQECYAIDEDTWEEREVGDFYDESGNRVQLTDSTEPDGLMWEKDSSGNYMLDNDGNKIPVWKQKIERYHPYLYEKNEFGQYIDVNGNVLNENGLDANGNDRRVHVVTTGWMGNYTASDIKWSMGVNEVFGVYNRNWIGLENPDLGYSQQPMVRLESFNLFTAYLVAVIMVLSMLLLSLGLVKRIYDIIVLTICAPLVCGTIPLDDGARFRAWRETLMSKVLIAFGAVIALNVFFMISGFIVGPEFSSYLNFLIEEQVLSSFAVAVFKMLLLLGGAICIYGSQTLVARILGTSADEGREAMQSFALITSGLRIAAVGALGAGRATAAIGRGMFGGRNRYGRERTGMFNYMARGADSIGRKIGGENYSESRGGRFVRMLGRMPRMDYGSRGGSNNTQNDLNRNAGIKTPGTIDRVGAVPQRGGSSIKPPASLRTGSRPNAGGTFRRGK